MRTRTKRLLFLVAIIISLAVAMIALRGQNQPTTSSKKEDPTPLQEMTERQRQHSKLYRRASRKDLRKTKESVQVVFTTPFIEPDDEKTPPTIEELLQRTTCAAEAIVIGIVENKTSQFTEDGGFVFTDYDVRVQEVLKNNARMPVQQNGTLILTRPGGAVTFDGKTVNIIDKSFEPLVSGNSYLLFLRQISSTGGYQAVDSDSSYQLEQNKVRRLTARQLPYSFPYDNDAVSFVAQVRTIANLCHGRSKGNGE